MVGCRVNATIGRPCGANRLIRIASGMVVAVLLVFVASCNTGIGNNPADGNNPTDGNAPGSTANRSLVIDSISPDRTAANFSTRVTIRGGPFKGGTSVLFGDKAAEDVVLVNEQVVTAMAPVASVGFVDVTVESDGVRAVSASGFEFTQPAGLQVLTVAPATGSIDGGTRVTIRGDGFGTDTGVLFGAFAASDIEVFDARLITATAPPHKAGKVDVTILTNGTQQVLADGFKYVADPVDDGSDADGDGLTDYQETTGWEIVVDYLGFGADPRLMTRELVTSDPTDPDTDDDGLSDYEEFLARSNPNKADTDGDKLGDYEEVKRWLTSPVSVDTDGDADGPDGGLPPNVALFDGAELFAPDKLLLPPGDPNRTVRPRATSPTLADTDGDGRTDAEEFDTPGFSPILAELPRLEIDPVGEIDIRLNKQYAESEGETEETSVTLTRSKTDTKENSYAIAVGASATYSESNTTEVGLQPKDSITTSFSASLSLEFTYTHTDSTAVQTSRASSDLQSKSYEKTETFSTGSIRLAVQLHNPTAVTYRISDINLLAEVPTEKRDLEGAVIGDTFLPVATLRPVSQEIVLAPGETTEPIEFSATEVDGKLIEELLRTPNKLAFDAASYDLQTADGLSFDFIRELTQKQSAAVWIDFGDGRVDVEFVATNVDRNPDSSFRGVTMREVLEDVLGYPYDQPGGYTTTPIELPGGGTIQVLSTLAGLGTGAGLEGWRVGGNGDGIEGHDFNDIVLHAGDSIQLTFLRDSDGDGLPDVLEPDDSAFQGLSTPTNDVDGDGLLDRDEFIGWIAFEDPDAPFDPDNLPEDGATNAQGFAYRRVSSNPGLADSDGDGLSDEDEYLNRTDPKDPDTDRDGLLDGVDPYPACRARTLYVNSAAPAGGDGSSWLNAMNSLQDALSEARTANAGNDCTQHVSQIWVAAGTYRPHESDRFVPFNMVSSVGVFGGFTGRTDTFSGETKRGQRNTNPLTNGTVLSGDLLYNDLPVPSEFTDTTIVNPFSPVANRGDNSYIIVQAAADAVQVVLDGFVVTQAWGNSGIYSQSPSATYANLLIVDNIQATLFGPEARIGGGATVSGGAVFRDCVFARNIARGIAGGCSVVAGGSESYAIFEGCRFEGNEARWDPAQDPDDPNDPNDGPGRGLLIDAPYGVGGGMAIWVAAGARVDIADSSFVANRALRRGGGLAIFDPAETGQVVIDRSEFSENSTVQSPSRDYEYRSDDTKLNVQAGGGIYSAGVVSILNSVVSGNFSYSGGGIHSRRGYLLVANSTIARNHTGDSRDDSHGAGIQHVLAREGPLARLLVENSIVWENYCDGWGPDSPPDGEDWIPRRCDNNAEGTAEFQQVWVNLPSPNGDGFSTAPELAGATVRNSIIQEVNYYRRGTNIGADPKFADVELANYKLKPGASPAIDRGNNFVDILPLVPGFQALTPLDFAGDIRIQDGDGDGTATVDLGAYEAKSQGD